ncbi:MAG: dUTP diphosphatase [Firmicutes bacterium]|nr:dUTP diphosphatase [Bacillota bacterium]
MKVPCKGCEDRTIRCHSYCERYKEFKIKSDERNQKRAQAADVKSFFDKQCISHYEKKRTQKGVERVKIKLDVGARIPIRAHDTDAGYDLCAREDEVIFGGDSKIFDTGVHVQLPKGTAGVLVSKSGLNVNHDITSTGLIDEGYTGSIRVKLYNHGRKPYKVNAGDKISQLVIIPVHTPPLEVVGHLEETERGDNGFGSSGK